MGQAITASDGPDIGPPSGYRAAVGRYHVPQPGSQTMIRAASLPPSSAGQETARQFGIDQALVDPSDLTSGRRSDSRTARPRTSIEISALSQGPRPKVPLATLDEETAPAWLIEVGELNEEAQAKQPLSPADLREAAYLLGRHVDGRPVGDNELDQLQRANASLEETRAYFSIGRGNVRADIKRSGNASFLVTRGVRDVLHSRNNGTARPMRPGEIAGVMASAHAGNCREHASAGQFIHAARLKPGERVEYLSNYSRDHAFNVATGVDGTQVVIDAWGEGPAVNGWDAQYMIPYGLMTRGTTTSDSASADMADFRRGRDEIGPATQNEIKAARRRHERAKVTHPAPLEPEPIICPSFAGRVVKQLEMVPRPEDVSGRLKVRLKLGWLKVASLVSDKMRDKMRDNLRDQPDPMLYPTRAKVRNEILAVASARRMGAKVSDAVRDAPAIVDGAKRLLEPDPNRGGEAERAASRS